MEKTNQSNSFAIIGTFLIFELLAFAGFSLANSVLLYGIVGFAILLLLILGTKIEFKSKGFSSFLYFVIPLFIYGVLLFVSNFSLLFDLTDNIFVPVALIAFSGIGALSREQSDFKLSNALLVIYGSLAALVLISYFWTMVQFRPFYTIEFKSHYIYYDGERSPVPIGSIAYFLIGFSLKEVSIEYFSFFTSILSTSVIALFFIKPKEDKKSFILYAIYALIGIIPLITMPTKVTLLFDFIVAIIIALIIVLVKCLPKMLKYVPYVIYGVIGFGTLCFLVLLMNAQGEIGFIKANPLFNKLFIGNRFAAGYNDVLSGYFNNLDLLFEATNKPVKLFGFHPIYLNNVMCSNSILVDNFMMSGLFGTIMFVLVFVVGFISLNKFLRSENVELLHKVMFAGFIIVFTFLGVFNYDMTPFVYYTNYIPIYMSGPFLIVIFMFGYTFKINDKKAKEPVVENVIIKEEEDAISL